MAGGRFHEALQQFGLALRQQPTATEPRLGLVKTCMAMGDGWAAAAWLSDACRAAPHRPELWIDLAGLLATQRREDELAPMLALAVSQHPDNAPLLQMQAECALRQQSYAVAVAAYRQLNAVRPHDAATLLNFGFCLEQTGALEEAAVRYREAVAQKPGFAEAHVNLAGLLWRLEDFQGALAHGEQAVAAAPDHPYAVRVLGTALLNLNRLDEAEARLRRALELKPEFALAEIDLAFCLLLSGRLAEGWVMYQRRWRDTDRMKRPGFFNPGLEWRGPREQPLAGKRIAVYAEQGYGDVLQFIRYVPQLQAQGATVFGIVPGDLAGLIEHSFDGVQCLTPARQFAVDCHVALLDLPLHCGTTLDNIPAAVPYLRVPPAKVAHWAEKLTPWDGTLKVGLAWCGSRLQVNNVNRASRLSQLAPLLTVPGVQCFSLQKDDAGPWTDVVAGPDLLVDLTPEWTSFMDSAAMISGLDLVITVDTAVAHLAGALGVPVWVMLPPNAEWRWLLERENSPWYPTLRLFRRAFGESRNAQVARVVQALTQRLAAASVPPAPPPEICP